MKVTSVTTLVFATLALASPAPAAQPNAPAIAQPLEVLPREATAVLEARKKKPKGGSSGNSTNSTATTMTPSRVLQLGALGLGVMEVVRLW
jgi:hypothetical protein